MRHRPRHSPPVVEQVFHAAGNSRVANFQLRRSQGPGERAKMLANAVDRDPAHPTQFGVRRDTPQYVFGHFRDIFFEIYFPIKVRFVKCLQSEPFLCSTAGLSSLFILVIFADNLIQPFACAPPANKIQQAKDNESDAFQYPLNDHKIQYGKPRSCA
jgi:hypothetical protein